MTTYNWEQSKHSKEIYYLNCNTLRNAITYNVTDRCDYCITINKQGRGKYFVYADEHTSDDMYDETYQNVKREKGSKYGVGEPYFTNLKAATLFAEGFAEHYVQCQIDIIQEEMYKNDPGDMLPPPNFSADPEMGKAVQNYLYEQATGKKPMLEVKPETTIKAVENISDIFSIDVIDQQLYADSNDIALDDILGEGIIDNQLYADNEKQYTEPVKFTMESMFKPSKPTKKPSMMVNRKIIEIEGKELNFINPNDDFEGKSPEEFAQWINQKHPKAQAKVHIGWQGKIQIKVADWDKAAILRELYSNRRWDFVI